MDPESAPVRVRVLVVAGSAVPRAAICELLRDAGATATSAELEALSSDPPPDVDLVVLDASARAAGASILAVLDAWRPSAAPLALIYSVRGSSLRYHPSVAYSIAAPSSPDQLASFLASCCRRVAERPRRSSD